jgi:hypothetical protein
MLILPIKVIQKFSLNMIGFLRITDKKIIINILINLRMQYTGYISVADIRQIWVSMGRHCRVMANNED